jgi:hypothetical protein
MMGTARQQLEVQDVLQQPEQNHLSPRAEQAVRTPDGGTAGGAAAAASGTPTGRSSGRRATPGYTAKFSSLPWFAQQHVSNPHLQLVVVVGWGLFHVDKVAHNQSGKCLNMSSADEVAVVVAGTFAGAALTQQNSVYSQEHSISQSTYMCNDTVWFGRLQCFCFCL